MASESKNLDLSVPVASEREIYGLSGPLHLTTVDCLNEDESNHQRSVAASLVQGVYILERDRQEKREGNRALAPPWWEAFQFQLYRLLIDDADSCVFGAIYQLTSVPSDSNHSADQAPRYVIAFRGTITKGDAFSRDVELDIHIIRNGLHQTSRFETAIQAVRHVVATFGSSNVWLAGHSLGAAMAMLAGKNMAKTGVFLEAFLFNPPFFSAPIERIKDKKVKHGIRFAGSVITAGLALAMKHNHQANRSGGTFVALSAWLPCLFVNRADHICSEYVGYFEHRKRMEEMGAGAVERLATQHSIGGLLLNAMGKPSEEPLHLIPSASLTVNLTPVRDFKEAHGIHQWWRPDLLLESKIYNYR
ncbi:UNVERIFIED_CONTAM: GDSL esterase/lipase [Sesamum angustifolium]|uniref:GDSL esterase/lipase n=1 Tax=Sesamum angustifolium TaxID=2727405 RepID=A0AAW2MHV1_9LAMI